MLIPIFFYRWRRFLLCLFVLCWTLYTKPWELAALSRWMLLEHGTNLAWWAPTIHSMAFGSRLCPGSGIQGTAVLCLLLESPGITSHHKPCQGQCRPHSTKRKPQEPSFSHVYMIHSNIIHSSVEKVNASLRCPKKRHFNEVLPPF